LFGDHIFTDNDRVAASVGDFRKEALLEKIKDRAVRKIAVSLTLGNLFVIGVNRERGIITSPADCAVGITDDDVCCGSRYIA
jgi:hypothetical protein